MIIVTVKRSNSRLGGMKKSFHDGDKADEWIEALCETLEDDGWQFADEDKNSDAKNGMIECSNQYEIYAIQISWRTLNG